MSAAAWMTVALALSAQDAQDAQAPAAKPRLLVLELKADEADRTLAKALAAEAVAALDDRAHLEVVAMAELKNALALEAERQEQGCEAESCAAELAGALGAELVLFGDITRLDDLLLVSVQLYDAKAARLLGREVVRAQTPDEALAGTRAAVRRLVPREGVNVVPFVGGVVGSIGLATAVAGTAMWVSALRTLDDPSSSGADKDGALVGTTAGPLLVLAGAVATAAGAGAIVSGLLLE